MANRRNFIKTAGLVTVATLGLRFADSNWKGNFRPCEIKTLRLNQNTREITEVNLLEE